MSNELPDFSQFDQKELSTLIKQFQDLVKQPQFNKDKEYINRWGYSVKYSDVLSFLTGQTDSINQQIFLLLVLFIQKKVSISISNKWKIDVVVFDIQLFDQAKDILQYTEINPFIKGSLTDQTHLLIFIKHNQLFSFAFLYDLKAGQIVMICPTKSLRAEGELISKAIIIHDWDLQPYKVQQGFIQGDTQVEKCQCLLLNLICEIITSQNLMKAQTMVQQGLGQLSQQKIQWIILKLGLLYLEKPEQASQTSINFVKMKNSYSKILADISDYQQDDEPSQVIAKQDTLNNQSLQRTKNFKTSYEFSNTMASPSPILKPPYSNILSEQKKISDSVIQPSQSQYLVEQSQQAGSGLRIRDFHKLMESMKQQILEEVDENMYTRPEQFIKDKLNNYDGFIENYKDNKQVVNIQLDSLNTLLSDYSKEVTAQKKKLEQQQSQKYQDTQNQYNLQNQDLQFVYQNDPQQYKKFLNLNSKILHNQIFDEMGLGGYKNILGNSQKPRSDTQGSLVSFNSSNKPKIMSQSQVSLNMDKQDYIKNQRNLPINWNQKISRK